MMSNIKTVILAAGGGTRMLGLNNNLPKCLLPIDSTTILGHQLRNVEKCRLKDVIISAGYAIQSVEAFVDNFNSNLNILVEFNPFFDISNNIISLWNVREHIRDKQIVIINGDNVFDYQILEILLENQNKNVLMVNKKEEYDGDDMKVQTQNGKIIKINKNMKSSEASGESIGIMKFSRDGANSLIRKIEAMIKVKENLNVFYLKAIEELTNNEVEVYEHDIGNLRWEEADFPEDYAKIKEMDWEQIAEHNITPDGVALLCPQAAQQTRRLV